MSLLLEENSLGLLTLKNRLVMAPMTRNRATDNIPNRLMATYYRQRSTAGLIVTEGTSPSPNGLGYPRIPGVFSAEQTAGWGTVCQAVHNDGGKVFMQLMHTGRISHPLNLPEGARVLAPSGVKAEGEIFTDRDGMKPHPVPEAMTLSDIETTVSEFARAARNAVEAGCDGVELHSANGYLLEQFLRPNSNVRTDKYGGSMGNRARFVLDVVDSVVAAIGRERVGIRLSPFGVFNDMPVYDAMEADYAWLAQQLDDRGVVYVHLVDHSAMGAPPVPESIKDTFRALFKGVLVLSGGYDAERAEHDLAEGRCDLVAVGRPFLANPDLVERWRRGVAVNEPDVDTFYTSGAKGYTDYPTLA